MGVIDESTSIKKLIERQQDFISELTLLQYHSQQLGVVLDRSPKCHPEIAGEGIEYLWALAKLHYRSQRIERKRGKDKFHQLVVECTDGNVNLNVERA